MGSIGNLGPIGTKPLAQVSVERSQQMSLTSDRRDIYYHLAALFPEDQVLQAMKAFPDEKDPQVICKYILFLSNQK